MNKKQLSSAAHPEEGSVPSDVFRQRRKEMYASVCREIAKLRNVKQRRRLKHVLDELFILHQGLVTPPGITMWLPGGIFPVPQTHPFVLVLQMASGRDDWRATLANEILLYLKKAHDFGHTQAVPDAFELCSKYRLPIPDWLRDAPRNVKRRGERSRETKRMLYEIDRQRFIYVECARAIIRDERKKPGQHRDVTRRDKFARAKEWLKGSSADTSTEETGAIKASHKRFLKYRDSYYLDPGYLVDQLRPQAPTVSEILS